MRRIIEANKNFNDILIAIVSSICELQKNMHRSEALQLLTAGATNAGSSLKIMKT